MNYFDLHCLRIIEQNSKNVYKTRGGTIRIRSGALRQRPSLECRTQHAIMWWV